MIQWLPHGPEHLQQRQPTYWTIDIKSLHPFEMQLFLLLIAVCPSRQASSPSIDSDCQAVNNPTSQNNLFLKMSRFSTLAHSKASNHNFTRCYWATETLFGLLNGVS